MDEFLGVPSEVVFELGKVVVASGRLEGAARDILTAFDVEVSGQFKQVTRSIRDRCNANLFPPWARTDAAAMVLWTNRADSAMDNRDKQFHSTFHKTRESDSWSPKRRHLRSGDIEVLNPESLSELAQKLRTLSNEGSELEYSLLPELHPYVYQRVFPISGWPLPAIVTDGGGTYPLRPTEEYITAFLADLFKDGVWCASAIPPTHAASPESGTT